MDFLTEVRWQFMEGHVLLDLLVLVGKNTEGEIEREEQQKQL